MWIGAAFFELSKKRPWLGAGFGASPQFIETSKIREHYYDELGLKDAGFYKTFRRLIDRMDNDWKDAWTRQEEARQRQREQENKIRRRR